MSRFIWVLVALLACAVARAKAFDYETLKATIKREKLTTVEATLAKLPWDLRSRFALVSRSRSFQHGSPLHPRVILFEDDAKFLMGFAGHPRDEGSNGRESDFHLEVIQFRDEPKRFDFYRIEFSPRAGGEVKFHDDVDLPAPTTCRSCHRSPTRPNWDGYPFWRGVYGSYDDLIRVGSPEGNDFERFIRESSTKGRYAFLRGLNRDLKTAEHRLEDSQRYYSTSLDSSVFVPYLDLDRTKPYTVDAYARPNYKLTEELERLNALKEAERLWRDSRLPDYAPALAAELWCDDIETFVPSRLKAAHPLTLPELEKQLGSANWFYQEKQVVEVGKGYFTDEERASKDVWNLALEASRQPPLRFFRAALVMPREKYRHSANMEYLLQGLGTSTVHWSLARENNVYIPSLLGLDPKSALVEMAKKSPEHPFGATWARLAGKNCAEIRAELK